MPQCLLSVLDERRNGVRLCLLCSASLQAAFASPVRIECCMNGAVVSLEQSRSSVSPQTREPGAPKLTDASPLCAHPRQAAAAAALEAGQEITDEELDRLQARLGACAGTSHAHWQLLPPAMLTAELTRPRHTPAPEQTNSRRRGRSGTGRRTPSPPRAPARTQQGPRADQRRLSRRRRRAAPSSRSPPRTPRGPPTTASSSTRPPPLRVPAACLPSSDGTARPQPQPRRRQQPPRRPRA